MEMMLQTQNLCKYFRKQKAVNNVSLNIEKGQIYGLLGPNGAGKSTTLKMLTGMMKPTAGKIYFDGKLLDRKDLSKIGALIEMCIRDRFIAFMSRKNWLERLLLLS